ncbi:DEAD/DEAH box helicase [Archaeoglobus neptunius]|uniref:DEAD/DEAH box helicase n=1 Tax=Archaeoglobus neptunius TaxID=2798580 RepID=UPI001925CB93|nr:DEAD/DEAH box helicase [Archaeoglobus neptunius]
MLNRKLREAVRSVGIEELTDLQLEAFRKISSGKDVLIIAPTGSGKTEAALIPVLNRILETGYEEGILALYITPLRALNRDMLRRIRKISEIVGISVDVRHGDTPDSERLRQSKNPPHLLITTPETFQILFLGKRLRKALKNVKFVIIDEIHELIDSERGVQLSIAIERLRELSRFQTIGLSATVSRPEVVSGFVGTDAEIVEWKVEKEYDVRVVKPRPDDRTGRELGVDGDIGGELRFIADVVKKYGPALIFVNTRQTAEALGVKLKRLLKCEVHHGSLSREARVEAEEKFASGELEALICTSSMELGIDIGHVEVVVQYGSPRQAVRLVQRVGRSGHGLGRSSRGYIVASSFDDILESMAIVRRAEEGLLEDADIHFGSLDVLANQICAMALEYGRIAAKDAYRIVRRAHPYRTLSFEEFELVCEYLRDIGKIFYDEGEIGARRNTRRYFYDNISMIPDERRYRVVDITSGRTIGSLDESFLSTFSGEIFAMKGELWRVLSVDDVVKVEPVSVEGEIPSWAGEEIPVPFEVAQDVGKIRKWIGGIVRSRGEKAAIETLKEYVGKEGAEAVVEVLAKQIEGGFLIPDDSRIVVDGSGGIVVVNACFGHKVNETVGKILALLLTARRGGNVAVEIDPYRIKLSPARPEDVSDLLRSIEPESVEFLAERSVFDTKLMQWKVVNAARKFGLIDRGDELSRINLRSLVVKLKDTPVYREALREIFVEKMDIERSREIFRGIGDGRIEISTYEEMSPISMVSRGKNLDILSVRSPEAILRAFRRRLENEVCKVYCLNCKASYSEKVENFSKFTCIRCGSRMIAVFNSRRDVGDFKKEELFKLANLVMGYGKRAVYALSTYGIGAETASRLLSRYYLSEDDFFKALIEAERNYVRTRRFWD